MIEYQIVRRDTCEELEQAVNAFINQGWVLAGGIAVAMGYSVYTNRDDEVSSSENFFFAQAISRSQRT